MDIKIKEKFMANKEGYDKYNKVNFKQLVVSLIILIGGDFSINA